MKKLLHIIATPRRQESRTLKVTRAFLDAFAARHPDWVVEDLALFEEELPPLTAKRVDGKYVLLGGKDLSGELALGWKDIVAHIERFKSADGYLISTPMWNFNVPYPLKQYIDIIVQPRYLFRYTSQGVEGLVKGKKMVVITSRGGAYNTDQLRPLDLQEPYLRAIFGFIGITDITFVIAQPMDAMGADMQREQIEKAQAQAREAGERFPG